jgi:hypothetical protein
MSVTNPSGNWRKIAITLITPAFQREMYDWCPTGECAATKITVDGYSKGMKSLAALTEYVLQCVEVIVVKPTPHTTIMCVHLHAHNDYPARLESTFIKFGEANQPPSDAVLSAYGIVSEKEISQQK